MKIRKIFPVLLLAGLFLASSAMAGNYPEFDAVGVDSANFFAKNVILYKVVTDYNKANPVDGKFSLEDLSNFNSSVHPIYSTYPEKFSASAGSLFTDPCWGQFKSVLTTIRRDGTYNWWIVLQMQPESDLDLNIYDCVMKWQGADYGGVFGWAEQTGRWRADWGKLYFSPCANPEVTVMAYPGPYAVGSFQKPQYLEARKMPGLHTKTLDGLWYTSKAHWDESIVIAMPETGYYKENGDAGYQLVQGDIINVKVYVPTYNTADIYYGADSVILKYIGMSNTYLIGVGAN